MPNRRAWGFDRSINIPSLVAILGLLGSLLGYVIMNDRRATKTEGDVEMLKVVDKGIVDHAASVEQVAVRDRAEMRDDIKEIKQMLIKERRHQ